MWRVPVLAVLISLGGVDSAQAQTKKELVTRLVQLQQPGIDNVGRALAGQTSQRVLQGVGQMIPRLAADKREAAAKDAQAEVKKFYDEVEPLLRKRATELAPSALGPVYEDKFTDDELKQIIAWLESPVAKKFQQLDGENANLLAQRVVADTRDAIEVRLNALEASLGKRLGLSAPTGAGRASAPKK